MREYDDNQIKPADEVAQINNTKPNYFLAFHRHGEQIGAIDFNGSQMVFTGEADASAHVFLDALGNAFKGRLEEEYQRGQRDARAENDKLGGEA